jgi:hypothetical protein
VLEVLGGAREGGDVAARGGAAGVAAGAGAAADELALHAAQPDGADRARTLEPLFRGDGRGADVGAHPEPEGVRSGDGQRARSWWRRAGTWRIGGGGVDAGGQARPADRRDEDVTLLARRLVAQRCLYGVDKNAYAVKLAKLSLWLVTLAKDLPFTFVDHALRHGTRWSGWTSSRSPRSTGSRRSAARAVRGRAEGDAGEAIAARERILELAGDVSRGGAEGEGAGCCATPRTRWNGCG